MSDIRRKFLINVSGIHLGKITSDDNWSSELSEYKSISNFLETENCITLYATLGNADENISFYDQAPQLHKSSRFIVFYKTQPATVTNDNLLNLIQIASINGLPTLALYNSLNKVFAPLLSQCPKKDNNQLVIQRQLITLQTSLKSTALLSHSDSDPAINVDENSLAIISSVEEEVQYWNQIYNSSKSKQHQICSDDFRNILKHLAHDFSVLNALPLNEIEDILESAQNTLDELWKHEPPYPKIRIQHLMDIITADIVHCFSKRLTKFELWSQDFNVVSELLNQCLCVGNRWIDSCKQLTQIFWPNYSLHAWTSDPYLPTNVIDLIIRLNGILNVRTVHRLLIKLLSNSEQAELKTDEMFKPFQDFDTLQCGSQTESTWKTALKQFEYLLLPAEQRIANQLKKQLSGINTNIRQLLYEYSRYSELINRPVLKQALLTERQFLLNSLRDYVNQLVSQMIVEMPVASTKYDTPQVVSEIVTTRQLEAKALTVKTICNGLLNDLQDYDELQHSISQLLKDITQQLNELFDSWTSEVTSQIKNGTLSLKETDPVVQFSTNKMMTVNYSQRLATLVNETRQLSAVGYRIPKNIQQINDHAKRFLKHAKLLEQIANFHNTIGDRMITSQRPMMLISALELSKLVQEEDVVSWGHVESVEKYIDRLKSAVEKLSKENNLLAAYHMQIMHQIKELEDVDLIKDYQKWKDATKQIRNIVEQVEGKGFKSMQTWKTDIDQNLCKVLEAQYVKSLSTLHIYLPEIHADLIYRNSKLQLSPDEDILKDKYQQQLKKFLEIPKHFHGTANDTNRNVFANIIEKSDNRLNEVTKYTEELFQQLKGVVTHWQSWLTLDLLDASQLKSWQDWDLHFRASKAFGQEIAKLPNTEEKIGCFVIGLSWLRSDLEVHNRSYWTQLVSSLKDSIAQDVFKLQNYVDTATAALNKQPMTLEQIGEFDLSQSNILKQAPEMEELFKETSRKSQMLSNWSRETVVSVNRLQAAWGRLQNLFENHQHILTKQVETIKTTLNISSDNLINDVERFSAKWDQLKTQFAAEQIATEDFDRLLEHFNDIKEKRKQWNELLEQRDKLLLDFIRFGVEPPKFSICEEVEEDLNKSEGMWSLFQEFYSNFVKFNNEEWIVFRKKCYKFEEFLNEWQEKLEKTESTVLVAKILKEILRYKATIPTLKFVRGEDFTANLWIEMFTVLEMTPKPIELLCLKDFLQVSDKLIEQTSNLKIICKKAAAEVIIRQALSELEQWDVQSCFVLTLHVDSRNKSVMLIKSFKEILNKIGDNQSLLQSVKNSADYESFAERAALWESRLANLDEYITALAEVQRKWIYLEPIFGGGTLDKEKARFDRLDRDFRYFLTAVEKDPRVTSLNRYPSIKQTLDNLQDQLSRCQQSLDNFLAEKRNKFPRFLFLGDDDLLEVVGQSSKEYVIQSHLKKLFAGIHSIKFNGDAKTIMAFCSLQGEIVLLKTPVDIKQPVEDWLNALVNEMQTTLNELLSECLSEGQATDPLKYPSQILCLADSINFTTYCEQAIVNMTLPPLLATYKGQLTQYNSPDLKEAFDKSLSSLTNENEALVLELKIKALILDTLHHISTIEELIHLNVTKVNDWNWQKQLRFYANSGNVTIKMVNATFEYSYEYLGNGQKLVRTPLTDRCFLTLTQAMHLGLGGNPYGPAGTGKTESVKALGSLLGRQVLVFNCDGGVDAASMGRILSGLVQSGAWGCFDEFNRLDEATLSAVSMHIQPIQNALRLRQKNLVLLNQEISVDGHSGIFVTLNPAGGGYGGRNKLPDNLKQLFRPVFMTHPDHEQIARILLYCDGYQHADVIGRKLTEIFLMSRKLLSRQQHYDWGLRALRAVLNVCGRMLKRARNNDKTYDSTIQRELHLVVQALHTDTLSKLTYVDSIKFDGIIRDIFCNVAIDDSVSDDFDAALKEACRELGLQINQRQIKKCRELQEQLKQRMGVVIVGPPRSGKSTLINILYHAVNKMGNSLKRHVFNPKSMSRQQLLGQIDPDTRQWIDGVLTLCSLQVTAESLDIHSWIICDGDIDPEWIESLNSVLDDNRLLSLPSGWRVQFGPNVNFIFETHNLDYTSPATVSRMGIIFLSDADLALEDFVGSLVHKEESITKQFVQDYFYKAVDWIVDEAELAITSSKRSVASTGISQILGATSKAQFTVALLNGLGGQLVHNFRELFAQQVFEWTDQLPSSDLLLTHYDKERDIIDNYRANPDLVTSDHLPLILTAGVVQTLDCLRRWFHNNNFLIVGPHGSAKTLILNYLAKEIPDATIATIHCSAFVSPDIILHTLSQHCMIVNSNKGRIYKPKKGNLILHFKNLHLVKPDEWGTNMLIEFLHQLISYKGLFNHSSEWIGIENVVVAGSLTATKNLSNRFISLLHVYVVNLPDKNDLTLIYNSYLSHVTKRIFKDTSWAKNKVAKFCNCFIEIYNEIRSNFTNIPAQQHYYNLNPHDLTAWCKGILRYTSDSETVDVDSWLIEVATNEAYRLFKHRLTNENDRNKIEEIINNCIRSHWNKTSILNDLKEIYYVPLAGQTQLSKFDKENFVAIVKKGILQYENEGKQLDLLIVPELLNSIANICKPLTEPGGNVLLIGRTGTGRRSSVRIISALHSAKIVTPISSKQPQLNNDLKMALQFSAVDGEQVYLLLEDHILRKPQVSSMINTFLCSGEIPGLFNNSEFESLMASLKDESGRENFEGNLREFFVQRVINNLHVIICLETENAELGTILENCPAFYQRCTAIWTLDWTKETLDSMPQLYVNKILELSDYKNKTIELIDGFADIHCAVDQKIASPIRYTSMIRTYIQMYMEKKDNIISRQSKLKAGVLKLTEARNLVANLKLQAGEQKQKLAEKQAKANSALDMITNTMQNANTHKKSMESLKEQTERENQQLVKRKQEIETELSEVEPLIQEARSAVGNIKAEAVSEIRSLRAPPEIIRDILEGVLRLMGTQDTSWNSMKIFLAKRGVKEDIRSFDASRISSENRQAVERLITQRNESFDQKNAKRASIAAAPLASWVMANVKYSHVLDKIKPLEKEQDKLQKNLTNAEVQLEALSDGLLDVDATVGELKSQLASYTKEAAEIEIHLNAATETLKAAQELVHKLSDEYKRWQQQLEEFSNELAQLPMYCLLAAAFITYLSSECEDNRSRILQRWLNITNGYKQVDNFKLEDFLSSERERLQWQSEGLSADQLSLQNAIMILKGKTCPLLLDPSSLALEWFKIHLKSKNVDITSENAPKFLTTLEFAIRFGKILIIEQVETVSPVLLSVLRNQFVYQSERKLINLNGKLIDYHNDFQLILSSRNAQLQLSTDIFNLLNVVNFITTPAGVTEQLITGLIRKQRPELEQKKKELLASYEKFQEKQYELQNQLLENLANSAGDILQNKELIASLNETKISSNAIALSLVESGQIQSNLQREYDVYRPICSFGSSLYFATSEFSKTNVLYSLSISAYAKLFLESFPSFEDIRDDFDLLKRTVLQSLYHFVSKGICKADRLKFCLHLINKIFPNEIPQEEWSLFLGQNTVKTDINHTSENIPKWIHQHCLPKLFALQSVLPVLYDSLKLNEPTLWKNFLETSDCHKSFPPHCKLTEFQKILIVQMLRPDRLHSALTQCVFHLTGLHSLHPDVMQLSQIYKTTCAREPILLITVTGTDPSNEIRDLAETAVNKYQYTEIAMGEGQETKALSALYENSRSGDWLILKNIHLVTSWLPVLYQHLQNIEPNKNFRLWLITEVQESFSSVLAQMCLKISYETPQGIRSNLQRTYATYGNRYIEKLNPTAAKIFFAMACVHAILQERRTYIPQGWSKWYDFADVDLSAAVRLTEELWKSPTTQFQWKYLCGLTMTVIYGGKMENLNDISILETYLIQFYKDETLSHRWKPFGLTNSLPTYSNFQEYINIINSLSEQDLPSYFGLPENIDQAWEKNVSICIISQLKDLNHPESKMFEFNRDKWYKNLMPLMLLWKKINQGHDFIRMPLPHSTASNESLILTFIGDEYYSAIKLIQHIHKSLAEMNKICKGNAVPDEKNYELARDLFACQTPKTWQNLWSGPNEPITYLKQTILNAVSISKMISVKRTEVILNMPIDLSFLFNPQVFLTIFKQYVGRKRNIGLDELILETNWTSKKDDNYYIQLCGLSMEGALFNGTSLSSSSNNSDSINRIPDCYITWKAKDHVFQNEQYLEVPLYYMTDRKEYLISLQVPSVKDKDKWLQAGLALFVVQ